MSDENLIEWKTDIEDINKSKEKNEKFSKKKRRRESHSEEEVNSKRKPINEESHQIIISDATNLTEDEKRKCK